MEKRDNQKFEIKLCGKVHIKICGSDFLIDGIIAIFPFGMRTGLIGTVCVSLNELHRSCMLVYA